MFRRLFPVRRSELRDAMTAFVYLFIFVAAHSILEATRDALFLAKIPTSRLPWVYVALAVTALLATRAQSIFRRTTPRRVLIGWTVVAAVGTLGISLALPALGQVGLYVFYIWSGVISTIVFIHFWSLVGGLFSIRQAKRLYGMIGLGAGLGAILGSGAVGLATEIAPRHLAMVAAGLFMAAAPLPFLFTSNGTDGRSKQTVDLETRVKLGPAIGEILKKPYIWRILVVSGLVTIAVTLSDFIFKSQITQHYRHDQLAEMFGRVNLVLNAASVCVQVFAVRALLHRLPLPFVFGLLPFGLAAGGVGIALTGALLPAILTKAVDGSVRFSVHRTAAELLLVPLEEGPRTVAKSFMDVLGQRGAQMIGSFVILAGVAIDLPWRWLAVLLALTATGAAVGAVLLRREYAQIFKDALSSGRRHLAGLSELDMASLESLLASLDSESDAEIVSALQILDREGKARVIPGSILYHPSEIVVVTSLRIFGLRGRKVALHAIEHLTNNASIRVRAEAMAARALLAPNAAGLRAQLAREKSPDVRAAIVATMGVFAMMPEAEAHAALTDIVESGSVASRRVLAEVVGWRRATAFEAQLVALSQAPEVEVKRAAITALGALGTESAANALIELLADSQVGPDVRAAITGAGTAGVRAARRALRDPDRPRAVRRLVPALFVDIDSAEGPAILLDNLSRETDGMVRYRSILALGLIVAAHPDVELDRRLLEEELQRTVARAYRYLDRLVALQRGAAEDPALQTTGQGLLVDLVRDKQRQMVGRVFRLLAMLNPNEEIETIFASMERDRKAHRGSALELIHIVLKNPLRDAVIGLVDDIPDAERRARGRDFHEPQELDYESVIAQMLDSSSVVVREFVAYHVGELRMVSQRARIEELAAAETEAGDCARALRLLTTPSEPPAAPMEHRRAG